MSDVSEQLTDTQQQKLNIGFNQFNEKSILDFQAISEKPLANIADDKAFIKIINQQATKSNKRINKAFAKFITIYIDRNGQSSKFKQDITLLECIASGTKWSNEFYTHQLEAYSRKFKIKTKANAIELNIINMFICLYQMLSGLKYNNYCSQLLNLAKMTENNCEMTTIQELRSVLQ